MLIANMFCRAVCLPKYIIRFTRDSTIIYATNTIKLLISKHLEQHFTRGIRFLKVNAPRKQRFVIRKSCGAVALVCVFFIISPLLNKILQIGV